MKILPAEDEPLSSFVLATRLRKLGYEVVQAADATWVPLDAFVAAQSGLSFCPTLCPACGAKES